MATPYITTVAENVGSRFDDSMGVIRAFSILNPKKLPSSPQLLKEYGADHLETLINFYGTETTAKLEIAEENNTECTVGSDINGEDCRREWNIE